MHRRIGTERGRVDRVCRDQPRQEQHGQPDRQHCERGAAAALERVEEMPPARIAPLFAPPCEFVEPGRRRWARDRQSGNEREEQWQQRIVERHHRRDKADDRINQPDHDQVAALGAEILPALAQRPIEIAGINIPDFREHHGCRGSILNRRHDAISRGLKLENIPRPRHPAKSSRERTVEPDDREVEERGEADPQQVGHDQQTRETGDRP